MREGYKKTKLGVVPEKWEIKKLNDVININPRKEQLEDDNMKVSFLAMADVSNDGRIVNKQIKDYGEVKTGFTGFKDNDVLLAKITPCFENGKRALAKNLLNKVGFGSTEFHVLRGNKKIISEYIYYFIATNDFRSKAEMNMTGSAGQRRVPTDFIKNFKLAVPPLKEQKKIASILSSVDEHIEEVDGMIEDLKELKKGLMQKLLTGQYTIENGKLVKTKEFKKTRLGMIPKSWELKNLFEVVDVIMGQSPKSENYNENNDGLPLIQGNADCKNRKTSPRVYTSQITKKCVIGDIIMTVRAPVGAVSKSYHNACIGRGVCALQPRDIDSEYLFQYMIKVEDSWSRLSQGSTFTAINSKDVKNFKVLVPPLKEQKKVASILSSVDLRIAIYKAEKQDLQQLKKGLMQQLLTGKVRVKV